MLSYEGVEVINPEGGKEDAEEEAQRGRWKDEVTNRLILRWCLVMTYPQKLIFYALIGAR